MLSKIYYFIRLLKARPVCLVVFVAAAKILAVKVGSSLTWPACLDDLLPCWLAALSACCLVGLLAYQPTALPACCLTSLMPCWPVALLACCLVGCCLGLLPWAAAMGCCLLGPPAFLTLVLFWFSSLYPLLVLFLKYIFCELTCLEQSSFLRNLWFQGIRSQCYKTF